MRCFGSDWMKATIWAFGILIMGLSCASAQDIRWHIGDIRQGSYVSIKNTDGGNVEYFHHVRQGKSGKLFVVVTLVGKKPSKAPIFTSYLDEMGNLVKWVGTDGLTIRYQPHDCKRVEGTCRYTEIRNTGERLEWIRVNRPKDGGMSYAVYRPDKTLSRQGWVELDEFGTAGTGWQKGQDGRRVRYKLVASKYK